MCSRIGLVCGLLAALVVGAVVSAARADLLMQYKFDENGGTTAADASGNGHTGAFLSTPTWTNSDKPAIAGNVSAVSMDGTSNDLATESTANLNALQSFTAMMWINGVPTGSGSNNNYPRFFDNDMGSTGYRALFNVGTYLPSTIELTVASSGDVQDFDASYAGKNVAGWHNWAITFNQGAVAAYLDGQLLGSGTVSATVTAIGESTFSIAGNATHLRGLGNSFDDFRFYGSQSDGSGALSQSEILGVIGVPEPGTLALSAVGALGLLAYAWKRRVK